MFQKVQFACSSASLAKKARAASRQMEGGQPRSQLWLPNSVNLRKWHTHEPCFLQSPSAACSLLQFARRSVDQLGDDICSSLLAVPRILGQEAFFFLKESMRRCLVVARFLQINTGRESSSQNGRVPGVLWSPSTRAAAVGFVSDRATTNTATKNQPLYLPNGARQIPNGSQAPARL
jgi:hypothetical protein